MGTEKQESIKNLGIGIYPGAPEENYSPDLIPGGEEYRNIARFRLARHSTSANYGQTAQLVTDGLSAKAGDFVSSWKSAGAKDEWLSIDLGAESFFDKMRFEWISGPAKARLQVSRDGKGWNEIATLGGPETEITFPQACGRFVKLLLEESASGEAFELGEWEIWGRGGTVAVPKPAPSAGERMQLLSGGAWKLCRQGEENAEGEVISTETYDDSAWLPATVPGTVLGSYIDNGAVPHPNFGEDQIYISDSYFCSDFWYRKRFEAHPSLDCQFLHFEGINYQAVVFLNGKRLGMIDGAFRAADFNVSGILREGINVLAVHILHNPNYGETKLQTAYTPQPNGGILGADNPTMHATIGWDWLPTVRGRNIGIYDEVWIHSTGVVTLHDAFVRSELSLPDTTRATVLAQVRLENHALEPVYGVLKWSFGDNEAEVPVKLGVGASRLVDLDPLELEHPRLWWPNGYGEQYLYPVKFVFVQADGRVSDECEFFSGIREMRMTMDAFTPDPAYGDPFHGKNSNQRMSLWINGRRFIGFGGNWGYPEHLLNYRAREYDIAVGYHAAMNFTMIRNWVGMTGAKAFYDACDRYGIVVWQDFWLANPWDGPDPLDPDRFNQIAAEYVRRIRNHPSIGLYVGRNEGYPPAQIDEYLAQMLPRVHPGIGYIPHSATDGVSGGGPYWALPVSRYFHQRGLEKMHSEMGMPAVMNYENMARAMGEENLEPVSTLAHPNPMYGLHDYTLGRKANAAQQTESFNELISKAFGEPADAREFAALAQWVNYNGYRAMFEARSSNRRGLLLWMSHPAWPSMVWQTYDYYFEPTGAYFGCKKACEPIHIQLNAYTREVEAVNYHSGDRTRLSATAAVYSMDGKPVGLQKTSFDLKEDSTFACFPLQVPSEAGEVYYVKLSLEGADGKLLSENFYVEGAEDGNLKALRNLPPSSVKVKSKGSRPWELTLTNTSGTPALMIRLKLQSKEDMILPVWYSDNYFTLLPGESRTVKIDACEKDYSGRAGVEISAFNLQPREIWF